MAELFQQTHELNLNCDMWDATCKMQNVKSQLFRLIEKLAETECSTGLKSALYEFSE